MRAAPLPQESLNTFDYVKRRQNIMGTQNDAKYELKAARRNVKYTSAAQDEAFMSN